MKIYIGADHNGFPMKRQLSKFLRDHSYDVTDDGDLALKADDDFPQFASRVAGAVLSSDDPDPRGILLCGSGQGMAMAANRFRGIRAALCWDVHEAKMSRNDDNANVLCLPAWLVNEGRAEAIVHIWLTTPFAAAARFNRRLKELDELG